MLFLIGCGSTNQPETNQPETNQPETNQPETNQPETNEPETNEPETNEPETNEPAISEPIIINEREHISLTAGIKQKLRFTNDKEVTWSSNNLAIIVDQLGNIYAKDDKFGTNARAIITATPKDGSVAVSCPVTIVKWHANLSSLDIEASPLGVGALISNNGSTLYYTAGPNIYSSEDGMQTSQPAGTYPSTNTWTPYLIKTPYSHYLRIGNEMYETDENLMNITEILTNESSGLTHSTEHPGLKHAFAYDVENKYIYAAEYTVENDNRHAVYRVTVDNLGLKNWTKVFEFDSVIENTVNSVRHIHVVTVDPYTGHVWVGTGDTNGESRLYYSETGNPNSFKLFAIGSQYYRILAMWFTKDYIYWNTDSGNVKQVISRIKRTDHDNRGELTPKLATENTKVGVNYYVYKSNSGLQVGSIYTETIAHTLNTDNVVYAIDDPAYDYREVVAELANGSHWYYMKVKDDKGKDTIIMSTSAETSSAYKESMNRDSRGRIFGIKEKIDGSVDVQELVSIGTLNSGPNAHYVQLVPGFQDDDGYIYFRGRETEHQVYKAKLYWKDK